MCLVTSDHKQRKNVLLTPPPPLLLIVLRIPSQQVSSLFISANASASHRPAASCCVPLFIWLVVNCPAASRNATTSRPPAPLSLVATLSCRTPLDLTLCRHLRLTLTLCLHLSFAGASIFLRRGLHISCPQPSPHVLQHSRLLSAGPAASCCATASSHNALICTARRRRRLR